MLKVGSKYFKIDGSWSSSEVINQHFLREYEKETSFKIQGSFDPAVTTDTTATFEIRVFDADTYQFDVEGTNKADMKSDIEALATSTGDARLPGNRIIARHTDGGTRDFYAYFYELQRTLETVNDIAVIEPTDESTYKWKLSSTYNQQDPTTNDIKSIYYLTNVRFKTFPNGADIPDIFVEDKIVSEKNSKTLDYTLFHFDVDDTLNNTEQLILNFFKLANGNATSQWGTNNKKTQELVSAELLNQYKLPTRIITFEGENDIVIKPWNSLRDATDDNRIYQFNRLTINDQKSNLKSEIEEVSNDTVAAGGTNNAYKDNAFSNGFN